MRMESYAAELAWVESMGLLMGLCGVEGAEGIVEANGLVMSVLPMAMSLLLKNVYSMGFTMSPPTKSRRAWRSGRLSCTDGRFAKGSRKVSSGSIA